MPAATLEAKPRPSMVSAKVPCTSSQARTQREQTMQRAGSNWKYGLEASIGGVQMVGAVVAVAHLAHADQRRPSPAIRSCRRPARSDSPADDRRDTAPSRRAAGGARVSVVVGTFMPGATGVVQEAGVPPRPSISTRHTRQEPNAVQRVGGAEFRDLDARPPSPRA